MRGIVIAALAIVASTVVGVSATLAGTPKPGPNAGLRLVVVTVRDDHTGDRLVYNFKMAATDRLYVTRLEAEVVHTSDGTSDEVVYPVPYKLGNVTVSRVQS